MQGLIQDLHVLMPPQPCQVLADNHALKEPAEDVMRGFATGASSLEQESWEPVDISLP